MTLLAKYSPIIPLRLRIPRVSKILISKRIVVSLSSLSALLAKFIATATSAGVRTSIPSYATLASGFKIYSLSIDDILRIQKASFGKERGHGVIIGIKAQHSPPDNNLLCSPSSRSVNTH